MKSGSRLIGQVATGSKSGTSHHCGLSSRRLVLLIPAPLHHYQGRLYKSSQTASTLPSCTSFLLSSVLAGIRFSPLLASPWIVGPSFACFFATCIVSKHSPLVSKHRLCVSRLRSHLLKQWFYVHKRWLHSSGVWFLEQSPIGGDPRCHHLILSLQPITLR